MHVSLYRSIRNLVLVAALFTPAIAEAGNSPDGELRSRLNVLLQEHVYLATAATGAALGGRSAEFDVAAMALDANSVELSQLLGSVYGAGAENAFLSLWRRHIGFFVEYTQAVAAGDAVAQEQSIDKLMGYAEDFAAFLSSANPNLPKEVVAGLVREHVEALKAVVDAQGAGDAVETYMARRRAAAHMRMIADPIAEAIVKQFPDRFAGAEM